MATGLVFGVLLLGSFSGIRVWAAQKAKIVHPVAGVHVAPDVHSPRLVDFPKDTIVIISSDSLKGTDGDVWYKTRLATGDYGYVQGRDLLTDGQRQAMRAAGVQLHLDQSVPPVSRPWSFVIRAMGLGGYRATPTTPSWSLYGGDFEFNYSFLSQTLGYMHRMLAIGPAFLMIRDSKVLLGSFVFRFYTPIRSEPEIRLRLGKNLTTDQTAIGGNLGLRYPFSLSMAPHLEGYFELGGLYSFKSEKFPADTLDAWGSLGLGLHF